MPNKTFYVADDDVALFARAQELAGGNLSAAITTAIRRYVETREANMRGLSEITVEVGPPDARRRKRFVGVRVARWRHRSSEGRMETYAVYRTAKDRLAVHIRQDHGFTDWANRWSEGIDWMDPSTWSRPFEPGAPHEWSADFDWSTWWGSGDSRLEVYDDLAAMREEVPPELADLVDRATRDPLVEDLDI